MSDSLAPVWSRVSRINRILLCSLNYLLMWIKSTETEYEYDKYSFTGAPLPWEHHFTNVVLGPPLNNQHWHNLSKKLKAKEFEMIFVQRFLHTKVEVMSVQSLWCNEISRRSIYNLFCFSVVLDLAFFACTYTVNSRVGSPICMLPVVFHVPFSVTRC